MTKKYELTDEYVMHFGRKLFRIVAMTAFANVAAGDIGGYVEKEENLSHSGDAWVYDNARVFGNALVFGNARVYGNAWVSGDAWVYDNARVYGNARVYDTALVSGNARVYDNAWVSGDAWVFGNARVYDNARVYGDARVYGNARVSISPINIIGIEYNVTISDNFMAIGCQNHSLEDWASFDDRRILEMDGKEALKFWRKHGQYLLSLRKTEE